MTVSSCWLYIGYVPRKFGTAVLLTPIHRLVVATINWQAVIPTTDTTNIISKFFKLVSKHNFFGFSDSCVNLFFRDSISVGHSIVIHTYCVKKERVIHWITLSENNESMSWLNTTKISTFTTQVNSQILTFVQRKRR